MSSPFDDAWFLTGPTAAGKSAVGVEFALRMGGEIVSLDSMALYRGMDIGTAKPTASERKKVAHHLIDIIEPHEAFSVAQYVEAASECTKEILSRGKLPVFVGGTPLYLKALLRGLFEGPPADWGFREAMEAEAQSRGDEWLLERVRAIDRVSAERLHARDTKRLIRALEVFEKTGRPISDWQQQFDRARPADQCRVFVLDWPRAVLYERINQRVVGMFAEGLVEEVRSLLAGGRMLSRTASQALGYREVIEHLAGQRVLAETIERVQARTRAFARRQLTWFRSLSECRMVPVVESDSAAAIAERIQAAASGRSR